MTTNDPKEIELLRKSGRILAEVLQLVASMVAPGVSAADLNKLADEEIVKRGARPAFKNYKSNFQKSGFPGSLCVSLNDEVVHGIPYPDKILVEGDIVGLDLGVEYQGYYTDAAITVPVGKIDPKLKTLVATAQSCLAEGLKQVKAGNHIGDIGYAIEKNAKAARLQVVRELVGHGVGKSVHEDPEVPCYGKPKTGAELEAGMVLAIEPMINEGDWKVVFDDDGWTVKTIDGGYSAHFEHTILVTEKGCEILTNVV